MPISESGACCTDTTTRQNAVGATRVTLSDVVKLPAGIVSALLIVVCGSLRLSRFSHAVDARHGSGNMARIMAAVETAARLRTLIRSPLRRNDGYKASSCSGVQG